MTENQHDLDFIIADTLEKLQPLNPDLYAVHYTELYTQKTNWTAAKLLQLEQDIINNTK